jgi:hypothetical protein
MVIELDRLVNACGLVSLAGTRLQAGYPQAGQRVTLRLEEHLVHAVADGRLWRTLPAPTAPQARARLRGARVAGPPPQVPDAPVPARRRVSPRGALQARRHRVHAGPPHAGMPVTVEVDDTCFRILDQHDTILTVMPRTNTKEVTRYKARRGCYGQPAADGRDQRLPDRHGSRQGRLHGGGRGGKDRMAQIAKSCPCGAPRRTVNNQQQPTAAPCEPQRRRRPDSGSNAS